MADLSNSVNTAALQQGGWLGALKRILSDPAASAALWVLIILYAAIALAGFLAPYGQYWRDRTLAGAPPTPVYMRTVETGALTWPYVLPQQRHFNPTTLSYHYSEDTAHPIPIRFFVRGDEYPLLGLFNTNVHLFGVDNTKQDGAQINLLGTDMNGRDIFSRLLYGGQISLTIGFISLLVAFPLGLLYGGISGYFGGWVDTLMMRVSEVLMSIPSLYLLITLAAIIPASVSSSQRFALVVVSLALIGWAGFSRIIRGMVLSIKQQEYVDAARALGKPSLGIITQHVLPQTFSFVVVAITLSVPGYILMESGLSFLGLGIQQPDASWGNMLKEAQTLTNVLYAPWMLAPGALIFVAVLAFNVLGDAVRDYLDPKTA